MTNIENISKNWLKLNKLNYLLLTILCLISESIFIFFMWMLGRYFEAIQLDGIINIFNFQLSIKAFYILISILLLLYLLSTIAFKHLIFKLSNENMIFLESRVLEYVLNIKYEKLSTRNKIELAQQINNDCVIIADFMIEKIPLLIVKIINLILILNLFKTISIKIFIIVLITTIFFPVLYYLNKNKYKRLNEDMNEKRMQYFGVLGGELLNIFLVKVNVWYEKTITRFDSVGSEFVKSSVKFLDLDNLINNMFFMVSTVMTVIIPIIFIGSGGNLAYLVIIIAMINQFYPACSHVFQIITNINIYENAKLRINRLLENETDPIGDTKLNESISEINGNINFKYESANEAILNNFDFSLEKGKLHLIKGQNGSGKSTFLKILLGVLYDDESEFKINDISTKYLDFKDLRRNRIAYCEQEPYIIEGTLEENILYNSKNKSLSKHKELIDSLTKHTKIKKDTILSQHSLSGGEKQKIAILRTLYKNADIYIFDEPTASLDLDSAIILKNIIKELIYDDKMAIIISHDETFDDIADSIITMSE